MTAASADLGGDGIASTDTFVGDLFVWLNAIRSDRKLPSLAFVVAYTIGQHMNRGTRTAFPGLLCLAEQVGRDEKSVRKAIHALVSGGHLLIVKKRGGGGSTHYSMPPVKRAKTPVLIVDDIPGERAKTPGLGAPVERSERPKTPSQKYGPTSSERVFSSVQSGRKRPPNQSQEPTSSPAAPQPAREGGGEGKVRGRSRPEPFLDLAEVVPAPPVDGVSDRIDFVQPAAVTSEAAIRRCREAAWRGALSTEPVIGQPDASAMHDAMADGFITEADVMTGIAAALALPDFRPRQWRSLVGFARKAASDRVASTPRPANPAPGKAPLATGLWQLEGGAQRSMAFLERAVAEWDQGFAWDEATLGDAPDSKFTSLPRHLWRSAPGKPRPSGAQIDTEQRPEVLQ